MGNSLFAPYLGSINPVADVSCFSARIKEDFFFLITEFLELGAGESPLLKDEVGLEMGCRSSQGCSVRSCKSQPLTDLVLGRIVGFTQTLGREFASFSVQGTVFIC